MMRTHLIEISGLGHEGQPVRFFSGAVAPAPKIDPVTGHTYLDVPGIIDASTVGGSVEPRGGIAEIDPVIITLVTGRRAPRGAVDAGILLDRHGPRSAPGGTQLARTLRQDGATIYTTTDPTSLGPFPAVVQVNREAILVDAAAGDGSPEDPWRLTVGARGAWGTVPARHFVDEEAVSRPHVLDRCVFWRTRRAIVYEAEVYGHGPAAMLGPVVEVTRGFLEAKPVTKGTRVDVEVIPNAAHVDRVLTAGAPIARLAHGWHYFDGTTCRYVRHAQTFEAGHAWSEATTAMTAAGSRRIAIDTSRHAQVMDVTLPSGHPRRGAATSGSTTYDVEGYLALPDSLHLPIGSPALRVAALSTWGNPPVSETITTDFTGGAAVLKQWPLDLFDKIAVDWQPGVHTGAGGQWADVVVVSTASGYALSVKLNVPARGPLLLGVSSIDTIRLGSAEVPEVLSYGLDLGSPDREGPGYLRQETVAANSERVGTLPCVGPARAFYQRGEAYITADRDVGSSSIVSVDVKYVDFAGEEQVAFVPITNSVQATDDDDDPIDGVWIWTIGLHHAASRATPSFGDWPGRALVSLSPTVRMTAQPTATVLLRLLTSNGGANVGGGNGLFDTEIFGAGLPLDDIDVESFFTFAWAFGQWDIKPKEDSTLAQLIEPILTLNSAALVMADVDGRAVLRLARVGVEDSQIAAHLTDADWLIRAAPETETDSDLVNVLTVKANYNDDDKPQVTVTRKDGASIEAYGEGKEMKIEAKGLSLPTGFPPESLPELRDAAASVFYNNGAPRRVWTATTKSGRGRGLSLGDVVAVTSEHLKGFGDDYGVQNARARIVGIKRELQGEGCVLRMTHTGVRVGGYAPAADVLEIIDASTIRISVNAYSSAVAPGVADYVDIDGYAVGELNTFEPRGANDAALNLPAIQAIDRGAGRITFSSPHGIAPETLGVIVPPHYSLASERQRGYAYFADDDGLVAGVSGYVIG